MPGSDFFRSLGFFVLDSFVPEEFCAQLCREMSCAESRQGKIALPTGEKLLDESLRRVLRVTINGPNRRIVGEYLEALRPRLESHFEVPLHASEAPEFLLYREGGFYNPHRDASPGSHPSVRDRKVSVVVFLNHECEQPALGCFSGGKLAFYGALRAPEWDKCAFTLDPHSGMLVAFRSDIVHEVKPVTSGVRFTLVSWFSRQGKPDRDGTPMLEIASHGVT